MKREKYILSFLKSQVNSYDFLLSTASTRIASPRNNSNKKKNNSKFHLQIIHNHIHARMAAEYFIHENGKDLQV